jgi:1-aminocyclopropane-1-carboxylate deaminase/D-cysteine desulfhydrase-like pyridoxal-dependent ACC family enzyme
MYPCTVLFVAKYLMKHNILEEITSSPTSPIWHLVNSSTFLNQKLYFKKSDNKGITENKTRKLTAILKELHPGLQK